jgi:hypothetical protein
MIPPLYSSILLRREDLSPTNTKGRRLCGSLFRIVVRTPDSAMRRRHYTAFTLWLRGHDTYSTVAFLVQPNKRMQLRAPQFSGT